MARHHSPAPKLSQAQQTFVRHFGRPHVNRLHREGVRPLGLLGSAYRVEQRGIERVLTFEELRSI